MSIKWFHFFNRKLKNVQFFCFGFFNIDFWLNNLTKCFIIKTKISDNNYALLYCSTIQINSDFVFLYWSRKPELTPGVTSRPNDPRINLQYVKFLFLLSVYKGVFWGLRQSAFSRIFWRFLIYDVCLVVF